MPFPQSQGGSCTSKTSIPHVLLRKHHTHTYTYARTHRHTHTLEGTNTYGTFLSSHSNGRCRRISSGSASAAMTMNSEMPRFSVLVADAGRNVGRAGEGGHGGWNSDERGGHRRERNNDFCCRPDLGIRVWLLLIFTNEREREIKGDLSRQYTGRRHGL